MDTTTNSTADTVPQVPLIQLKTLWLQVSGTVCNLQCSHCFISCGPGVSRHKIMSRDTIKKHLQEAEEYSVEEYYLTGGETFINPELTEIISDTLISGNVTVLTNGTLITKEIAGHMGDIRKNSAHTLNFRVSLESPEEEENDRVRGKGSFHNAWRGIRNLAESGFNPIITATRNGEKSDDREHKFRVMLDESGVAEPRYKTIPLVYLGRAEKNIRPYESHERVTENCFSDFPKSMLQCSFCRMITSEGVYVCPILIDDPSAKLGASLTDCLGAYSMQSRACYTCRTSGLCCSNTSVTREDVKKYYGNAAEKPQPSLCCPTIYDRTDTSHIPQEVLDISCGCGSPVSLAGIQEGETMLDLGSGGGIDCFIAAKSVGPEGSVIGVDMTDEMLSSANGNREKVTKNLGYNNVEFRKGVLENIPADSGTVDIITSNCVINLSVDKKQVFKEIYRVLTNGGRFVISDIVADKPVPERVRSNKELWGECISGSLTGKEFMNHALEAGFYGIAILSSAPYRTVEGIRFESITFRGYKFLKGEKCVYIGQTALYKGPFSSINDDDGHLFPRDMAVEVCTDTAAKLQKPPYAGLFEISDPTGENGESCEPGCC